MPNIDRYKFDYTTYQRRFKQPLQTSHGEWAMRAGIIIYLTNSVGTQAGEIAPMPWFGSESLAEAIDWCERLGDDITQADIDRLPDTLPACQFGFGSAMMAFASDDLSPDLSRLKQSALLPTGAAAIAAWQTLYASGYKTFKWKIGVAPIAEEEAIWRDLMAALPPQVHLRLDANGGLSAAAAHRWLETCDREPRIEFIEQPLAPDLLAETIDLAKIYHTPIALDESVSTVDRLQAVYDRGWRGIYVIKPGIAGFPWRLSEFIATHQLDVVFSSVLETEVGRTAALSLATKLQLTRALGFGVEDWFTEKIEGDSPQDD